MNANTKEQKEAIREEHISLRSEGLSQILNVVSPTNLYVEDRSQLE